MPGENERNGNSFTGNGHEAPTQADDDLPKLTEVEMAQSEQAAQDAAGAGPPMTTQQQAEAMLDASVTPVMVVLFQGMLASVPGVRPDVLFRSLMRVQARMIGDMIVGPMGPVFQVRESIRKSLIDSLKGMPVKLPPEPAMNRMPIPRNLRQ